MAKRFAFGGGHVMLGADGGPVAFAHPRDPGRSYLLDAASQGWHGPDHRWGSGFVITPEGSGRWQAAADVAWRPGGVTTRHRPRPGLELVLDGRVTAEHFVETYTWTNTSARPVQVTGLAVSVPVRDVYDGAASALARSCHAHVFTAGAWSWILAEPMSGTPPLLGVIVREGELWAYSIESRNRNTSSDSRGHLLVHATDHARNPDAFGGQPILELAPGQSHTLSWEVGWYDSREAFLQATDAPAALPVLTAPLGTALHLGLAAGVTILPGEGVAGGTVTGGRHGVRHVDLERDDRRSRTAVAFLAPVRRLVEARVERILAEHRPAERPEPERYAFVPVDTRTGLRQSENGWPDWSDGAERIGMPVLLQQARLRGWGDQRAVDDALRGFARFARERLIQPDGAVRRSSSPGAEPLRLYNTPWLAHFFLDQFHLYGDAGDLDLAAWLLEAGYALGASEHLSIGQAEAVEAVSRTLEGQGRKERACSLRKALIEHADRFVDLGTDLPAHEVAYEQSMVAPLVSLLATAYSLQGEERFLTAARTALGWLRAFGGPQPHVRTRDIAIRHWDGYWFGIDRQWGDTFPHYWSVLTAMALRRLPEPLKTEENQRTAEAIFAANLVDFTPDGGATCTFVMPSCVDGRPAHRADPLANDQDWALALLLRAT
ncbi:hypothetical protein HD597_003939 [Nonomuraea thailandensis]|uniref:Uncharacterized protein n=1 Tax=Nonomuraea thailandensis TaxID=1188745 RepID=A0A9X2K217_9ACTN|nr:hypothetical protein [Nonomuraea thailandensis]MCP2356919.1 hypothetical protein [Nonomuraea thailandensis]